MHVAHFEDSFGIVVDDTGITFWIVVFLGACTCTPCIVRLLSVRIFFVHSGYCAQINCFLPTSSNALLGCSASQCSVHAEHCEKWLTKLLIATSTMMVKRTANVAALAATKLRLGSNLAKGSLLFLLGKSVEDKSLSVLYFLSERLDGEECSSVF